MFTVQSTHNYDILNGLQDWQYLIAGREYAPTTGRPHLQCWVYFNKRKTFNTVKAMCPFGRNWKPTNGTAEQNRAYCSKDGDFFEAGELPDVVGGASGGIKKAKNFKKIIDLAEQGNLKEIKEFDPSTYFRHYHTIKRIVMDNPRPVEPLEKLSNEWIYGKTGLGKSRLARSENPGAYVHLKNKWWLGYKNEPVVIFDDVSRSEAVWIGDKMKNWADHYPFIAETKGDGNPIRPEKIIVTSNYTIDQLWGHDEDLCDALKRRFTVRHITEIQKFDNTKPKQKKKKVPLKVVPPLLDERPLYVDLTEGEEDSFPTPTPWQDTLPFESFEENEGDLGSQDLILDNSIIDDSLDEIDESIVEETQQDDRPNPFDVFARMEKLRK